HCLPEQWHEALALLEVLVGNDHLSQGERGAPLCVPEQPSLVHEHVCLHLMLQGDVLRNSTGKIQHLDLVRSEGRAVDVRQPDGVIGDSGPNTHGGRAVQLRLELLHYCVTAFTRRMVWASAASPACARMVTTPPLLRLGAV